MQWAHQHGPSLYKRNISSKRFETSHYLPREQLLCLWAQIKSQKNRSRAHYQISIAGAFIAIGWHNFSPEIVKMLSMKQRLVLVAISLGLFGSYSVFGILQERIFRVGYASRDGQSSETFTFAITFVCLQCLFYATFSKGKFQWTSRKRSARYQQVSLHVQLFSWPVITRSTRLIKAILPLRRFSTLWRSPHRTQRSSLFPIPVRWLAKVWLHRQTAAKIVLTSLTLLALKPIPTMVFGSLVGGKSYPIHKYLLVLLIVTGAVAFLYKSDRQTDDESYLGHALVGISLLMNGCTAGVQEKMRSNSRPSSLHLMLFINSWSSLFLVFGVAASGEFKQFLEFCKLHPQVVVDIGLILLVGGCGQLFTCKMITNFGVVPCCLVLTVRKFFNVMFSVLYFGNKLSLIQWLATALIFASLIADSILSFINTKGECCENVESTSSETKIDKAKEDKSPA